MKRVGKVMFWALACTVFVMLAFMLGESIVYSSLFYQKIVLDDTDQIVYATDDLNKYTKKVLVPEGFVTSSNETDVIYLRYKVYIREADVTTDLETMIDFIIDDEGKDVTEYFDITKSTQSDKKEPYYITYAVRLKNPATSYVYEQLASKTLSVKVRFWFTND